MAIRFRQIGPCRFMTPFDATLCHAAMQEDVEVLKRTLSTHGHLINVKAPFGYFAYENHCEPTPLLLAIHAGHLANVEALLSAKGGLATINAPDVSYTAPTLSPIASAMASRQRDIVLLLRIFGADTGIPLDRFDVDQDEMLQCEITEEDILRIQSKCHFDASLTRRLVANLC